MRLPPIEPGSDWKWALGLTILIEVTTCLVRFGIGLETTRDTAFVGSLTFGWRIHHGYIGILMVLLARAFPEGHLLRHWGLRIGGALFASDMIHHFAVLWPVTGSPEFDLRYPGV